MDDNLSNFKRGWRREDAGALYDGKFRLHFKAEGRAGAVPDAVFADDDEEGAQDAADRIEADLPEVRVFIVRYGVFVPRRRESA